ncbi:MAG: alpha-amylase family glycosyl hydrolase, partial [Candidatus Heimdallarchaeota archaeon]
QHPWFIESKASKDNSKSDWYVWQDGRGKDGRKPPNNWRAIIGGSAWEWCEEREQFYLHQFLPYQPDLNWWNNDVQEAMYNHIRFWLDKGVDGYRLDIIHTLFEDQQLKDNPGSWRFFPNQENNERLFRKPIYTQYLPETLAVCKKLREIVDSYKPTRMLVGEAVGGPKMYKALQGEKNDGLNLVFNFNLGEQKFSANKFQKAITGMEEDLSEPFWPCFAFSNHDFKRAITRYGNDPAKARIIALLLLTLRGTPFIYYGEELGMPNVKIPDEELKDPIAFHKVFGIPLKNLFGRDGCRTPMQWDETPLNAGFSKDPKIKPWLPVGATSSTINVKKQQEDKESMLSFYKELITVRKQEKTLQEGELKITEGSNSNYLIFERILGKERTLVILNFSKKYHTLSHPYKKSKLLLSTITSKPNNIVDDLLTIYPLEGVILKIEK